MTDMPQIPPGLAQQGSWSVATGLIVEVAQRAAAEIPGVAGVVRANVERGSGSARPSRGVKAWAARLLGRAPSGVADGPVRIELGIVVDYGRCLPEMADEVRERTARAVSGTTGHQVVAVDVTVSDLYVAGDALPAIASDTPSELAHGSEQLDF